LDTSFRVRDVVRGEKSRPYAIAFGAIVNG